MKSINLFTTVVLSLLFLSLTAQDVSPFIHVDQFGYRTADEKVAVLSDPINGYNGGLSYSPGPTIELRSAQTDAVIFSASPTAWNGGATHAQSGDRGWWFDFSAISIPGSYYIYDPTNNERSAEFDIQAKLYGPVIKAAMRMFYYNRCNFVKAEPYAENAWTDGMSFMNDLQDGNCRYIFDQGNAALEKDLRGGWFDAGDYNKYVTFVNPTIHNLLWAFEENPDVFGDNWDLPESGNAIPDILDELKWELDWLLRMNNPDGSTHIKMGSKNHSENALAPPSANTDQRYYGPTCSAASIAVAGMFAHAAKVYSAYPSMSDFVTELENSAVNSWNYFLPFFDNDELETGCDDGSIVAGDADWTEEEQKEAAIVAAIHLFELTNGANYHNHITTYASTVEPLADGWWAGYKLALYDALLHYSTLSGANSSLSNDIRTSLSTAASNNWNDFFGFSNSDLYRAFMPDWSYHWGSNFPKSGFAVLNQLLVKYNINPSNAADYNRKALEQLHYFHGVNPNGLVYLSNMYPVGGDRCVNEIYHTWFNEGTDWDNALTSLYGPPPGYVSGGANSDFTVGTISPPSGQPDQKSYLDFNDGYPSNSWEISEPSQTYQAVYVRHLAWFTEASDISLGVELTTFEANCKEELQRIVVKWETASEQNNDYFLLEKSNDGREWQSIKKIKGLGNSQTIQAYFYEDINLHGSHQYYRLKQVDFDGQFQYSSVLTASCLLEGSFGFAPNPTVGQLLISSELNDYHIKVNDHSGRYLFQQNGQLDTAIDLSKLPDGVYLVTILDKSGQLIEVKKIVKGE